MQKLKHLLGPDNESRRIFRAMQGALSATADNFGIALKWFMVCHFSQKIWDLERRTEGGGFAYSIPIISQNSKVGVQASESPVNRQRGQNNQRGETVFHPNGSNQLRY